MHGTTREPLDFAGQKIAPRAVSGPVREVKDVALAVERGESDPARVARAEGLEHRRVDFDRTTARPLPAGDARHFGGVLGAWCEKRRQ